MRSNKSRHYNRKFEKMANVNDCPDGCELIETFFNQGPLGVSLKWSEIDGLVTVSGIAPGTQAVSIDVHEHDELWCVGTEIIASKTLTKPEWNGIVEHIKSSQRPLRIVWKRKLPETSTVDNSFKTNVAPNKTPDDPRVSASRKPAEITSSAASIVKRLSVTATSPGNSNGALQDLLELANRLTFKEKPACLQNRSVIDYLVEPTRQLIISSSLSTETKSNLWTTLTNTQLSKRHVVLLSDLLLVTIPAPSGDTLLVDHWIPLAATKIHKCVFSIPVQNANSRRAIVPIVQLTGSRSPKEDSASPAANIEITWPNGTIKLFFKSIQECDFWYDQILKACATLTGFDAIYHVDASITRAAQIPAQDIPLITIHEAVLARDEYKLRDILDAMASGRISEPIDDTDDCGNTALHYACIFRLHSLIQMLYDANANICYEDDHGLTPLHWSAMQLDSKALTIMLSNVIDPDLCSEKEPRTPLYLACSEGFDLIGEYNGTALRNCLDILLANRADPDAHNADNVPALHALAIGWKWEGIHPLTLAGANIYKSSGRRCLSALHQACRVPAHAKHPLRDLWQETRALPRMRHGTMLDPIHHENTRPLVGTSAEDIDTPCPRSFVEGVRTLRAFLRAGCRPNSRNLDGQCPLQILFEQLEEWGRVREAVCVLLMYGARPTVEMIDPAEFSILKEKCHKELKKKGKPKRYDIEEEPICSTPQHEEESHSQQTQSIEAIDVKQSFDDDDEWHMLTHITPDSAIDYWTNRADLHVETIGLSHNALEGEEDATVCYPLDGKEKCLLCSAAFSFFRRQHHCRLCNALCCDDCSKKRVVLASKKERVCDSCYNLAAARLNHYQEAKNSQQTVPGSTQGSPTPIKAAPKQINTATAATTASAQGNLPGKIITDYTKDESDGDDGGDDTSSDGEVPAQTGESSPGSMRPSNIRGNSDFEQINTARKGLRDHEKASRSQLFGSVSGSNTSASTNNSATRNKSSSPVQKSDDPNFEKTMNTMSEVTQRLKVRGEKLSKAAEKSEELAEQSSEFARLARQLKEDQQKKGFFSWL